MSPTSSQMQKVEPSRIVSCGKSAPDDADGARLGQGFDDELVDVDMEGPGEREEDAVGDVLGAERVDALVRLLRLVLVAAEADAGEVRLDEAGIDSREPDRATQQVLTERVGEAAHGVLGRDIDRSVLVGLAARDRAHVDDVPTVADTRQAEAGPPAVAAPMPLEAPVTIAVFPSSPPTIRRRLARGRQQGLAAPKVQLGPLRREERLGLRELGVGLRTATRGGERLGPMQTCDRLGSLRTDSLVDGRSGREVALRYCNACLEPWRRRHGLRLLQVLLLPANVAHEPRQVLDEPLVELGREREELVNELLGLAALSVEQKRPGMDFKPGMQQLRVPDRARELEAALGVGERGAHVALSHEGAARHHQDWADEVVVYVSHLRQELARRAQALLPGACHL